MKRPKIAVYVAVPLLVVMLAFVAVLALSDPGGKDLTDSPLLGRQAPDIAGETIHGEAFDLADQRGQWVLVNFFQTTCIPCVREHPELVEFSKNHAEEGDASVVSVVFESTVSSVETFFADNGGDWPVVNDPDGFLALEYGVSGVPESYLIAPDGTVATKIIGGVTVADLETLLDQAQGV